MESSVKVAVNVRPLNNEEVSKGRTDCVDFILGGPQTGSGKTYTMGTNYNGDGSTSGIIPQIYREQVKDLLKPKLSTYKRKRTGPAKAPLRIRESKGVFIIPDVTEPVVSTKQDMASFLSQGSSERVTGSTNMNSESSRSHAIFTISMEQRRSTCIPGDDPGDGSESADTSGTDGLRQKEGSKINRGLLALGKDSLGGNSKTVMIACVSPADTNAKVTRSTLDYASRARNIQNKATVRTINHTAQMQRKDKISVLQARNDELELKLHHAQVEKDELELKLHHAQKRKVLC
ncbi:hypothetical protein C5167_026082 [Papaver somniferum]|nr:hypothetical protein C5167_026082 [Papaver somniferum]